MTALELWILAAGLAMDGFALSVSGGIFLKRLQWRIVLKNAFLFGFFQMLMPAIGWAGLAASIWSVIVPALLLRASRRKFQASLYRVPGGSTTVPLLLVYGIIVAVCHTLYVFNLLPVFK